MPLIAFLVLGLNFVMGFGKCANNCRNRYDGRVPGRRADGEFRQRNDAVQPGTECTDGIGRFL